MCVCVCVVKIYFVLFSNDTLQKHFQTSLHKYFTNVGMIITLESTETGHAPLAITHTVTAALIKHNMGKKIDYIGITDQP